MENAPGRRLEQSWNVAQGVEHGTKVTGTFFAFQFLKNVVSNVLNYSKSYWFLLDVGLNQEKFLVFRLVSGLPSALAHVKFWKIALTFVDFFDFGAMTIEFQNIG